MLKKVESQETEVKVNLEDMKEEEFAQLRMGNHRYEDEGKIYHMAIIDYLQEYNYLKKAERCCVPLWTKG